MQTVVTTAKAPFHKANLEIQVIDTLADKMIANGWATRVVATIETPAVEAVVTPPAPKTKNKKQK